MMWFGGKWKVEPNSIKPYDGTFIDSEETNTEKLLKYKKVKKAHILIGCGIISATAIWGIALWFYDNFTILP